MTEIPKGDEYINVGDPLDLLPPAIEEQLAGLGVTRFVREGSDVTSDAVDEAVLGALNNPESAAGLDASDPDVKAAWEMLGPGGI